MVGGVSIPQEALESVTDLYCGTCKNEKEVSNLYLLLVQVMKQSVTNNHAIASLPAEVL